MPCWIRDWCSPQSQRLSTMRGGAIHPVFFVIQVGLDPFKEGTMSESIGALFGTLFTVAFVAGLLVFCLEVIKRLGRIAVALEKLAGILPADLSKPNVG